MFFSIDTANGIAIYDQIVRQVIFAIATEGLAAGELVPSVRELAKRLAVNPNTVARAYRELQNEGVLVSVRGTGLEVSPAAAKICRDARVQLIRERIAGVLTEAVQSGLDHEAVQSLFDEELHRLEQKPGQSK